MHHPRASIRRRPRQGIRNSRPSATTPQAVAYLRLGPAGSTAPGRVGELSLAEQRDAISRAATQLGATVVEQFTEVSTSAGNGNRPAMKHLLRFVRHKPITYCIVYDLDRLASHFPDAMGIVMALLCSETALVQAVDVEDFPGNHAPLDTGSDSAPTPATPRTPNREE